MSVLENGLGKYLSCPLWSVMLAVLSSDHYFGSAVQLEANCNTCTADVCETCYYFSLPF